METLAPAELLVWRDGRETRRRYWAPPDAANIHDRDQAAALVETVVADALRAQMLSDVPVWTFLSGGIDPSLVTAVATATAEPITAFTMRFAAAGVDERPFAARAAAAAGARAVVGVLGDDAIDALIDEAAKVYDLPFAIGAALPRLAVSRLAGEHGAKVVLTGDGADELFAGYRHCDAIAQRYRQAGREPGGRVTHRLRAAWSWVLRGPFDPHAGYGSHNGTFPDRAAAFAGPAVRDARRGRWREERHFDTGRDPVDAAQRADLATYMTDEILVKVARAAMAHGIEARVLLLELPLIELAFRIDPAIRYAGGECEALLKRAARRWLPDDVLSARKKGFSLPVGPWARRSKVSARVEGALRDGALVREGLIDAPAAIAAANQTSRPGFALLQLYLTERWAAR